MDEFARRTALWALRSGWRFVQHNPYLAAGKLALNAEYLLEKSPYWPKGWVKPVSWAEHKSFKLLDKYLRQYASSEQSAYEASMSFTPQQKRKGTFPRGYIEARKKARVDSDDAEGSGVARDLAPEFEMAGSVAVGAGAAGSRRKLKIESGKKRSNASIVRGLTKASTTSAIVRYQNIRAYETSGLGGTAYGLCHTKVGLTGANPAGFVYPVHLFDLTCCPLNAKTPSTAITPTETVRVCPQWVLGSDSMGNFEWVQTGLKAQDTAGVENINNARWWIEDYRSRADAAQSPSLFDSADTGIVGRDRMCLKWSDIRLQFLTPRAQPANIDVYLVQFKEQDCDPYNNGRTYNRSQGEFNVSGGDDVRTGVLNDELKTEWNSFCKQLLKPRIYNPIDVVHSSAGKMFKVLKHQRIVGRPDTSVNLDTLRPNMDVKLFHRHNRVFNFRWEDAPNTFAPNIEADVNELDGPQVQTYFKNTGMNHPYVHPKARVFLMIVGDDYTMKLGNYTNAFYETWPDPQAGYRSVFDVAGVPAGTTANPVGTATEGNTTGYNVIIRNKWMFDHE